MDVSNWTQPVDRRAAVPLGMLPMFAVGRGPDGV